MLSSNAVHVFADVIRFDGKLSRESSIDQDSQRDRQWPSMGQQSVQTCSNGSACEQHVVYKHDVSFLHGEPHLIDTRRQRFLMGPEIVPEKCDVEFAAIDLGIWQQLLEPCLQTLSKSRASGLQANQIGVFKIMVLDQLVSQSIEDERELR